MSGSLVELLHEVVTRLFAAAARLHADFTVFVHLGVLLALVAAELAGGSARLELRFEERHLGLRLPREDARGGLANVGAIQVQADAVAQVGDHLFRKTGVGARGADLDAVEGAFNDLSDGAGVEIHRLWMFF